MVGRKRVFLTGGTGNWGRCVLREFADRADRIEVTALVLDTPAERARISEFAGMPNLRVVFGDVTSYPTVASCLAGADYVLHVAALVSPQADDDPPLTQKINIGSAANIIRAVQAQPDPAAIGVVMIGSVAETGDRNPPRHWGRVGDPLQVSRYDEYGQTKVVAERALIESGLPRWAWLRQTGIFHPGILSIRDAIMTHSPFAGVMEWVSAEDSARLLANICEDGVPDDFWGRVYNIGGGEDWRLTNWELQTRMTAALGVTDVRRWYSRNWFATRNFHGHWYTDSDDLEALVPFRHDTFDQALARAVKSAPRSVRVAGNVPAFVVKNMVIRPLTRQPRGTMAWIRDNDETRIEAHFGSRQVWEAIGDWSTFIPPAPSRTPLRLDHGYDESVSADGWDRALLAGAAEFRGGRLLSRAVTTGDQTTPLHWRCGQRHEFTGSPRLILAAGHWCPDCVKDPVGYREQARYNHFLAQVLPDPVFA